MKKKSNEYVDVVKSSGDKVPFSKKKLKESLIRSGVGDLVAEDIVAKVSSELYEGISTQQIYNRAFSLLKKHTSVLASKYKLKKAIYELGPTGFPFEKFISNILHYSGYKVRTNEVLAGVCVAHEVDVVAEQQHLKTLVECKFHSDEGRYCDVKIPLYIHSRFNDIESYQRKDQTELMNLTAGWVVTNTRFSKDAVAYGQCAGLYLLSWDHPKGESLRERIDGLGLYPITVSTILSKREKEFLLGRDIVLCKQLLGDRFYLDHLGITEPRKEKILEEIELLCAV